MVVCVCVLRLTSAVAGRDFLFIEMSDNEWFGPVRTGRIKHMNVFEAQT